MHLFDFPPAFPAFLSSSQIPLQMKFPQNFFLIPFPIVISMVHASTALVSFEEIIVMYFFFFGVTWDIVSKKLWCYSSAIDGTQWLSDFSVYQNHMKTYLSTSSHSWKLWAQWMRWIAWILQFFASPCNQALWHVIVEVHFSYPHKNRSCFPAPWLSVWHRSCFYPWSEWTRHDQKFEKHLQYWACSSVPLPFLGDWSV